MHTLCSYAGSHNNSRNPLFSSKGDSATLSTAKFYRSLCKNGIVERDLFSLTVQKDCISYEQFVSYLKQLSHTLAALWALLGSLVFITYILTPQLPTRRSVSKKVHGIIPFKKKKTHYTFPVFAFAFVPWHCVLIKNEQSKYLSKKRVRLRYMRELLLVTLHKSMQILN